MKYVFYVRANQEPEQNTSLQLYLSMCGLAPCKMLTSDQTFPQGREPATNGKASKKKKGTEVPAE